MGDEAEATIDEQLRILTGGCVDVISEADLRRRLERSRGTGEPLRVKLGVDPTASDIHLGFAVVLRKLRQFQDLGHVAVLIIGDFTAMVGDPTGRSATRPRLSREEVDAHAETYIDQVGAVLDLSPERVEIRRNSEWLAGMGMEDVLRLTASTTVARMLERNDFAQRYTAGDPISVMELLYPLLQGRDSVEVRADVELGGTDQLFNNLMGRQLQAHAGQEAQVVMATPLLEGLDGVQKMSKSLGNYVGITEPPAEQFGKIMSIPDALVPRWLALTTGWHPDAVDAAVAEFEAGGGPERNAAKRRLARTVVDLYHPAGSGEAAEAEFDRVFKQHAAPSEVPDIEIARSELPMPIGPFLNRAGLVKSNKEGRRQVDQGAVRIDGERVTGADRTVTAEDVDGRTVQAGKRSWARIVVSG
ncbi:MAG: tyrosine--tRNA ligase [Acidimicrobiia bacterium]